MRAGTRHVAALMAQHGQPRPFGACCPELARGPVVCGLPTNSLPFAAPAARYLSGSQRSEDGPAWGELLPWWAEQLKDWEGAAAAGQPTTPAVIPVQREWAPQQHPPPDNHTTCRLPLFAPARP
jgi:hypothetical protein